MMDNILKAKKTLSLTLPKIGKSLSSESADAKSKIRSGLSREFSESKVTISKMSLLDFLDPDDLNYYKQLENNNITFINGIKDSLKVNNMMINQNEEFKNTIKVKDALFLSFLASMEPLIEMLVDKLSNLNILPGPGAPAGTGEIAEPIGVSYDPGQPGLDITFADNQNRALYPGVVVKIDHQYSANSTGGDGRRGSGYGNYIVIRSNNPITGGQMDVLYAHFPDGELNKFKVGDNIGRGQFLGRMATAEEFANPRTRPRVGSGTAPHMSIDFYQPADGSMVPASEIEKVRRYTDEQLRSGGFERMRKREQPQPVSNGIVIAIGTNDYGTDPDTIKSNVKSIIEKARQQGFSNVIIIPPSEEPPYSNASKAVQEASRESGATIEKARYDPKDQTRPYTHLDPNEARRIKNKYPNSVVIGDSNAVRISGSSAPNIRFQGATSDQINRNIARQILSQLLDKN